LFLSFFFQRCEATKRESEEEWGRQKSENRADSSFLTVHYFTYIYYTKGGRRGLDDDDDDDDGESLPRAEKEDSGVLVYSETQALSSSIGVVSFYSSAFPEYDKGSFTRLGLEEGVCCLDCVFWRGIGEERKERIEENEMK